MRVRALQDGFYGGSRKRAGTEFDVKSDERGRWWEVIDGGEVEVPAAKPEKAKRGSAPKAEPAPVVSTGDQDVI